jgi:hypothetical protein
MEFVARLAALVPAPRVNLIRFHELLGPAATWRSSIVPVSPGVDSTSENCGCEEQG